MNLATCANTGTLKYRCTETINDTVPLSSFTSGDQATVVAVAEEVSAGTTTNLESDVVNVTVG